MYISTRYNVYFELASWDVSIQIRVRLKGFFSFRPKPKLAETAIFLFGRNRYINRKIIFVSAETDTKTETSEYIEMCTHAIIISNFELISPRISNIKSFFKNHYLKKKNFNINISPKSALSFTH